MTEKLFYKDSHLSKFDAEVLSCVRAKRQQVKDSFGRLDGKAGEYYEIELDRTAFFPEGGGQYADTGVLYMADDDTCGLDETARKKVQVLDVRERNGRIFHITDGFIEAKTAVKGSIDWEERFMKMQQHTGEHIVSGLIHAAYGYNNVGKDRKPHICNSKSAKSKTGKFNCQSKYNVLIYDSQTFLRDFNRFGNL